MPAAAVIPALLVYINAAAFKAPVVAFIVPIRNLERSLPTYTILFVWHASVWSDPPIDRGGCSGALVLGRER